MSNQELAVDVRSPTGGKMIARRELLRTLTLAGLGTAVPQIVTATPTPTPTSNRTMPVPADADPAGVWICWIGHSTVLINLFGTWILTDPVLFDNFGLRILGMTFGPRRHRPPIIDIDSIPRPDLVLLSHAHIDHMDIRTLLAIAERHPGKVDVITATRTMDVIEDMPWRSLHEMDWGERATIHGCDLRALRVKHNGWRLPGEPCRANGQPRTGRSFNGYLIERNGYRIVFGGDTAYTTSFKDIGAEVDVAIMPIGAYEPYPDTHCTPEEALAMCSMMRARHLVPIHHSTFCISEEPMHEPMQRLRAAIRTSASPSVTCIAHQLRIPHPS